MTRRQAEILRLLVELTADAPSGVHYTDLARHAGVSKWTAYDMLTELEAQALAQRWAERREDTGQGGRPRVLFAPTARAFEALGEVLEAAGGEANWEGVRQKLLRHLRSLSDVDMNALTEGLRKSTSSLSHCAHALASLMAEARRLVPSPGTWSDLYQSLQTAIPFQTRMGMLSGTLAGWVSRRSARRSQRRYGLDLAALEAHLARLRATERAALWEFARTALRRLAEASA